MTNTFNGGVFNGYSAFRKKFVPRPFIPNYAPDVEDIADNIYEINPPRSLKIGALLDEYTGEPVLDDDGKIVDFYLPLAEERNEQSIIMIGASGSGKCLAKGTKVLMYTGKFKNVEDLKIGDRLMGVDSKPRRVMDLAHGFDVMYEIKQSLGKKYTVNSEHILMLKFDKEIKEIKAKELIRMPLNERKNVFGYKVRVEFPSKPVAVNPYIMGAWYAKKHNGGFNASFKDIDVVVELENYFIENGIKYTTLFVENEKSNSFDIRISKYIPEDIKNDLTSKMIPDNYIYNNSKVRAEFLAGYLDAMPIKNGDIVIRKTEQLEYLVNSLGLYYHVLKNYVVVRGDFTNIPFKTERMIKNHLNRVDIENVGMGEYFGFVLDKDGLFLLEDFTVTHNTVAAARLMDEMRRKYGRCLLIFDVKNQYISMNKPNQNPKHIEILESIGEKPEGCDNLKIFIPRHMIKKFGKEVCQNLYEYTDIYTIKTCDLDATSMLILGNKDKDGKDYVNMLCGIMDNVKELERENGFKITIESLMNVFMAESEKPGKRRSGDTLCAMLDNLANSSLINDDGNDVTDLFHKPKAVYNPETDTYRTTGKGDVVLFNSAGSGADDIQTIAIVNNMINTICNNLILKMDKKYKIPLYRPFIGIEESSVYFGRESDSMLVKAFNYLENVMGRSAGIGRLYIYQKEDQIPKGLIYGDNCVQIIIRLMKSTKLKGDGIKEGKEIFKKGLAKVEIKNVGYMNNREFLVQIYPPKCDISS